jgi:flagellar biosynthesis protein FliP
MTDVYNAGEQALSTPAKPQYQVQKKAKKKIQEIKDRETREDGDVLVFRQSYLLLFFRLTLSFLLMGVFYGVLWLFALLLSLVGVVISPNSNPVISIVSFLFFLLVAGVIYIKWKNTYYTLRPKSIELTTGLFEIVTRTLRLDTFAGIVIEQGLLGKLLNYGTIVLEYQAKENATEPLTFFPNPERYGKLIKERIKNV